MTLQRISGHLKQLRGQKYKDIELALDRTDFRYRAEKFGIHQRLATRLDNNHRWADFFLQFGENHNSIPATVCETVGRLILHVAEVVELGRTFNELHRRFDAVLGALDRVAVGLCLAREDGAILLSNESALALFDSNPLVSVSVDDRLVFDDPVISRRVSEAIAATASTAKGLGNFQELLCMSSDQQGNHKLLIEVAPTRDSLSKMARANGYDLISLIDPASDHTVATERLGAIYKLTPFVQAVWNFLVLDNTNSEIAEERVVSVETIKTQTRFKSDKTSTSSGVGLFRLALKPSPIVV